MFGLRARRPRNAPLPPDLQQRVAFTDEELKPDLSVHELDKLVTTKSGIPGVLDEVISEGAGNEFYTGLRRLGCARFARGLAVAFVATAGVFSVEGNVGGRVLVESFRGTSGRAKRSTGRRSCPG